MHGGDTSDTPLSETLIVEGAFTGAFSAIDGICHFFVASVWFMSALFRIAIVLTPWPLAQAAQLNCKRIDGHQSPLADRFTPGKPIGDIGPVYCHGRGPKADLTPINNSLYIPMLNSISGWLPGTFYPGNSNHKQGFT